MSLTLSFTCPCCNGGTDSMNITHNLKPMAIEAGIGGLWDISESEPRTTRAKFWIPRLELAVHLMTNDPARFRKLDSPNGWGLYDNFLPWVQEVLRRCKASPNLVLRVHG
jgi:hypothetical protein